LTVTGVNAGLAGCEMVTVAGLLNDVKQKVIGLCAWLGEISGAANQNTLSICARRDIASVVAISKAIIRLRDINASF
jgi:hypothetical protein